MVPPTYCDVNYSINPWMKEKPDITLLEKQWQTLFDILVGVFGASKVHRLEPKEGIPELCYCGDSVFLLNGKAMFGNFLHEERVAERDAMKDLLRPFEFEYTQMPELLSYEGSGDTSMLGDRIVMGHGQRTNILASKQLAKWSGKEVIPMHLVKEEFYHLDIGFLPLSDKQVMLFDEAFDKYSIKLLNVMGYEKVFVQEPIARTWILNSIVHGKKIIAHSGAKEYFKHLQELGFEVIEVDISEFLKLGGGIKCLALIHHEV